MIYVSVTKAQNVYDLGVLKFADDTRFPRAILIIPFHDCYCRYLILQINAPDISGLACSRFKLIQSLTKF